MAHRFVALREDGKKTYLYQADLRTRVRQVIWGDFLQVRAERDDGWLEIDWAPRSPTKRQTLYIHRDDTDATRPLEIIFVDVGQGDGAVLISPERGAQEHITVVDAGEGRNMHAFLSARFATYRGFNFAAAVLTHPDQDHYGGFLPLFADHRIGFRTVYHNGLVERPVAGTWEKIGTPQRDAASGASFVHALAIDRAAVQSAFGDLDPGTPYAFAPVMKAALDNPRVGDIRMLSSAHAQMEDGQAYMPGLGPSNRRGYTVQVLGPVVETAGDGRAGLRRLGDYGETKNGHSVLLKLRYGGFSVLFGGDLNVAAEQFLLRHYTGRARLPAAGTPAHAEMVAQARTVFGADIMKSCHHGSEKVTDAFLDAVRPAAFVISSGDAEGHVHPRPDLLGRLGQFGRGGAPVILSTELQRSTRALEDRTGLDRLLADIDRLGTGATPPAIEAVKQRVRELARSNVEVYGAIYLKTDGRRLITAFRIESPSEIKRWFSFRYRFNAAGELVRDGD